MAFVDWTLSSNNLASAASFVNVGGRTWQWFRDLVAFMKTQGWSTRGSSIDGTSGTLFSATPDGTDYWAGLTQTQAQNSTNTVWHVLQHATSGIQICVGMGGSGGSTTGIVAIAKNKFETAGAWRNAGSVTANVRPTDVTSSPASDREVNIDDFPGFVLPAGGSSAGDYRFSYGVLNNGTGFYALEYPDSAATPGASNKAAFMGVFPLTNPTSGDTNPYIVQGNNQGSLTAYTKVTPSIGNANINGRTGGGLFRYGALILNNNNGGSILTDAGSPLKALDPFSSRYRALALPLWTDSAPAHIRTIIADFYAISDSFVELQTYVDTAGGRYIKYGEIIIPWGAGAAGDHPFEPLITMVGFPTSSVTNITQKFNIGLD